MASEINDRAYWSDLYKFLDEADAADRRYDAAVEMAEFLTGANKEYDPWSFNHFEEAMVQAAECERRVFWSCAVEAVQARLLDDMKNHLCLEAMRGPVERYWHRLALEEAIKRIRREE